MHSETFQPFLAGHIPPEWFLIRDDHLSEVRGLRKGSDSQLATHSIHQCRTPRKIRRRPSFESDRCRSKAADCRVKLDFMFVAALLVRVLVEARSTGRLR